MTTLQLTLPWPPSALSPNTRSHWRVLALAKKAYRAECARQALAQGIRRIDAERLHVSLLFVPPNRRAYDLDNLLARFKAGGDGLADVLQVDDRNWSLSIAKSDQIGGMVKVTIAEVHASDTIRARGGNV